VISWFQILLSNSNCAATPRVSSHGSLTDATSNRPIGLLSPSRAGYSHHDPAGIHTTSYTAIAAAAAIGVASSSASATDRTSSYSSTVNSSTRQSPASAAQNLELLKLTFVVGPLYKLNSLYPKLKRRLVSTYP
jgi:hypothetical protein